LTLDSSEISAASHRTRRIYIFILIIFSLDKAPMKLNIELLLLAFHF
jgi:hypothetical protein